MTTIAMDIFILGSVVVIGWMVLTGRWYGRDE